MYSDSGNRFPQFGQNICTSWQVRSMNSGVPQRLQHTVVRTFRAREKEPQMAYLQNRFGLYDAALFVKGGEELETRREEGETFFRTFPPPLSLQRLSTSSNPPSRLFRLQEEGHDHIPS